MKIFKGLNSIKMKMELRFFFSAYHQMVANICTKIHENILEGIKVTERTLFHKKNFKGP